MFRNDKQTCAAILALLAPLRLGHLWSEHGPSDEALKVLEQRGGALSYGEALMVFVAFDFWNGHGKAQLGELLSVLDAEHMERLASLLIAVSKGPVDVDRWLANQA
jgi:hypothetical protein